MTGKANSIIIELIAEQKQKEEKQDIWKDSPYKDLVKLQSNNAGIVGEQFIENICKVCNIESFVNGAKTKQTGGGKGDGIINGKNVEIKTAHEGSSSSNFQHELGETPWKADYMLFIDVSPHTVYLTIFKNFSEELYKSGGKCEPYFPTRRITWRKGKGAFKLDTTISINEANVKKGYTYKIDDNTDIDALGKFIKSSIE